MNNVDSSHVQITVTCERCGHTWDVEDYDALSVQAAEQAAREAECQNCNATSRQVRFYNIKWDTTDDDHPDGQDVDLPDDVTLEVDGDVDLDTEGADVLSDKYGWCVFSFDYEETEP